MGDSQSETAGTVKCSDDGVVVIPVEVRDVLGIKNKEAFLRIEDISVAKIVDEDEDATLEDAKGGDGE
jgi:bifunctional DNA-binding transcriptional regulator/antitoxin component of YhaV-PrlF toxin-antitoxin module